MREEGPNRNKKWGILKYPSVEISTEKSENIPDRISRVSDVLGQKLGYDNSLKRSSSIQNAENHGFNIKTSIVKS